MIFMDLISIWDLEKKEIEKILDLAEEIRQGKRKPDVGGKIAATLFFEP